MAKSWREVQKEKEEHEKQRAEQAKKEKDAKLKGLQSEVQPEREHNVRSSLKQVAPTAVKVSRFSFSAVDFSRS